jgi:hypothetical protein
MQEIVSGIKAIYAKEHLIRGYADPLATANAISQNFGIENPHITQALATIIRSYPTKRFLYTGVVETLDVLLETNDSITVWTDDFPDRVLSSGIWKFRKDLPDDKKRRLKVVSGLNKHEALAAKVIPSLREGAFSHVVFVDDKDKNLDEAKSLITQLDLQIPANFVRIEWGGQMDRESSDDESNVIFDIKDLLKVRQRFAQERDGQIKWLIDFNDALLDRNAYIDARCMKIEGLIQGRIVDF